MRHWKQAPGARRHSVTVAVGGEHAGEHAAGSEFPGLESLSKFAKQSH
jgi:hypothetical protein